jgi:outer membrane receptor protein involved in Fe transport
VPLDLTLPPVVVQAPRLPPAAGDPAYSIVEIEPVRIRQAERLDAALATAPGFSLFRRTSSLGANPTTQGVSLRAIAGSAASRALVTLDGVPQNDLFGGWVIWTALPPETISRAVLVRGAGAGPYGAGALTGVVALDQPAEMAGDLDIEGGSLGYARAAGATQVTKGPARLFLDAAAEHSDGWIPVIEGRGRADRRLDLTDWSASQRLLVDLGSDVLAERVAVYQEDRGAGVQFARSRERGLQTSLTLVAPPGDRGVGWRLQGWLSASDLANSSAAVSADRNSASLTDDQYATPALGVGFNAAVRRQEGVGSWELGTDVGLFDGQSRDRLYQSGMVSGLRTSGGGEWVAGVYGEASRTLGRLLITGGLRLDTWQNFGSNLVQDGANPLRQSSLDRGGVAPTGRLGVRQDISDALYLRAAAYAGFRPATLNELHRTFRLGADATEANAELAPERLYGAEFGLGGGRWLTWDADVFVNRLADAVTNVTIGRGPATFPLVGFIAAGGTLFERENAGEVNAYGVEGEASRALSARLQARVALTYTHATVDGGTQAPQLTGLRPALTPRLTATAGLDWRIGSRLMLSAEGRFRSASFDDDLNTRPIRAGAGFDARAEWRLSDRVSAFVAADNLFNARLEAGRSAAGVVTYDAPRQVRVGLSWRG